MATDYSSAHGYWAVYMAPEATFGADPTPATYVEVIKFGDNREIAYFDNDVIVQGLQQHTTGVIGHKSDSKLDLEMYLHGYSSAAVSSAPDAADVHPDARLTACALGGYVVGGYDGAGVTADTTVDTINCTATDTFVAGQAVLIGTQVGWIKQVVSGTQFTLEHSLESVPPVQTVIYGSITTYPTDAFDSVISPSVALKWAGLRTDDCTTFLGCRPSSAKITGAPKDFLRLALGFNCVDFARAATGGNPEPLTYAYPAREQIVGARLLVQENTGTVTLMEADCAKFDLDFGLGLAAVTDLNAAEGVAEWRKTAVKVELSVDPVQGVESNVAGWEYLFAQDYGYTVMLQVGTTAGRTISICMPNAHLVQFPATTDRDGLNAKSLQFRAMAHVRDTGSYGDAYCTNKVCKVAWL